MNFFIALLVLSMIGIFASFFVAATVFLISAGVRDVLKGDNFGFAGIIIGIFVGLFTIGAAGAIVMAVL